jgi:hypothetical protein
MRRPLLVPASLLLLGLSAPTSAFANVVINELLPDPDGADDGKEWIELHNTGSTAVNLQGWRIESGTSSYAVRHTFESSLLLPAGGYLLVGGASVAGADVVATGLALGNASSTTDAVRIVRGDGTVIDTVLYGSPNTPGWLDDSGAVATSFAPKPTSGRSLARRPDGADSNRSGDDFVVAASATPGDDNDAPTASCTTAAAASGLVLNELLPDPDGADTDKEWIELYNGSSVRVDLTGWRVEAGTSSYSRVGAFTGGELAPGAFLVVGGSAVPEASVALTGTLGNAGSAANAARLVDCVGGVADTVVYGSPNTAGWVDDTGATATSLAPKPASGASLARRGDGVDTDASSSDFVVQPTLTPGRANPTPPPCETGYLVINELLPDPPGADDGQEWIELFNPGATPISVGGWSLDADTSSFGGGAPLPEIDVPAGGHLVVGQPGVAFADVEVDFSLGNATSNSDGLQLRDCEGVVVDTVIYGTPNSDGWVDDTGEIATSLAPKAGSGASLARRDDGADTDRSGDDFVIEGAPTPGDGNNFVEPVVCVPANGPGIVLNELLVNPDGTDDGLEWIELFNPTDAPISVAGWGLSWPTDGEGVGAVDATLPGGLEVPAGGFLLIGDALVEEPDVVVRMRLPNGTGGDAVILYDCEGTRIDGVIYGDSNEDGIPDDRGAFADPYVRQVSSGASLARREDGVDTDAAEDWGSTSRPTPGASNNAGGGGGGDDDRGCACQRRSSVSSLGVVALFGLGGLLARRRRRG